MLAGGTRGPLRMPFGEAAQLAPDDGATRLYVERCTALAKAPPEDWDGVWVYKTK